MKNKNYEGLYNNLIENLNSIIWYNGIYEGLWKLKEDLLKSKDYGNYLSYGENDIQEKGSFPLYVYNHEEFDNSQFEIFWMLLVLKYGNYGTSPRTGWLELKNKKEIIEFIDTLTELSKEGSEIK